MNKSNTTQSQTRYPARYAWLGLAAVYLAFLSVGFVFHFLPPILPVVIADLGISHGQAGLLMSMFALPGILLSLPGGWLVDRYGERLVGSVGVILMGVGTLLLGLAAGFPLILLARVLSGVGAMVGVVALQRLVIRLFAGRSLGLPIGIAGSAVPVGIVIVLNAAGPVAQTAGWRIVAQRVGGATVLIGLVFAIAIWILTRGTALGRDQKQDDAPLADRAGSFRPIWIAGAVWFCANGAMTAFMTFAPDHFQGLGFDISARGLFTSIPMWTSAALGMITGWLTDRHGGRAAFMITGMTMMAVSLLLLPMSVVPPSLIGLALGLSLAAVVTPTIALPGVLLPSTHTGRGYGILATCANLGIFVVPPLAGWSRDLSGGYVWPFVIMGGVAIAGVLAAEVLRRGRFMPGFSRQVLVVALLLVIGCGSQDRYDVVRPGQEIAGEVTWGHFSDETVFLGGNEYEIEAGDAWSATDFVIGDADGRILRVQGSLLTPIHSSVRERVIGIICLPDGDLLLGLRDGRFRRWSGETWSELPSVPTDRVEFLTTDHLDRPLAHSSSGDRELYRFENDTWVQVAAGFGRIDMVWAHPHQGTWLATSSRRVLELANEGIVSDDSLALVHDWGVSQIAGDGGGRLAFAATNSEIWLRQDNVWSHFDTDVNFSASGMFWQDGRLYTNRSRRDLMIWENDHWQEIQPDVFGDLTLRSIPLADKHLILEESGAGYLFDGAAADRISPAAVGMVGLNELAGQLVALLIDGSLFRVENAEVGSWRNIGRTSERIGAGPNNMLLRDDRGQLIAWTRNGLEEWQGAVFVPLLANTSVQFATQAADGEILLNTYSTVGSLRAGQITWLNDSSSGVTGVMGIWRRTPTTVDMLTQDGMFRLDAAGESRLLWVGVGWSPQNLIPLSADRAMVLGERNVRELIGDDVVDVTPIVNNANDINPTTLDGVCELPDRRILGWMDRFEGFILMDDVGWHTVVPASGLTWFDGSSWPVGKFVSTPRNGLFVFGPGYVVSIDTEGGAP